ncbi:MAG: hypothetical protein AB1485_02285 [Candidatus Thermoplasmatota archaeon]
MVSIIEELELKNDELVIKFEDCKRRINDIEKLAKGQANKRDELNKKVRLLREQANENKAKLSKLREEINKIKVENDILIKEERILADKLGSLIRASLPEKGPYLSLLKEEVKQLEFKHMTTALEPKKEKELVERVSKLKTQIREREKILEQNEDIKKTRNALEDLKKGVRERKNKISELTKECRETAQIITKTYREADRLRKEADEAQREFVRLKQILDSDYKQYSSLSAQLRDFDKIISALKQKEGIALKAKIDSKLKEKAQKIYERFKQGEKLSTDDLLTLQKAGFI